jgi:formate-dependent nitrite reductase membrane component NrfD
VVLRRLQAPARPLVIAAALMVLVGGFFLRAVIVFGGQI